MTCGHIGWVTSKVITWIIFAPRSPNIGYLVQGEHLKIWAIQGWSHCFKQKPAMSLKRGKIGSRLLLMTSRKLHTHFRLISKSTTLDDLELPLRTPFQNTCAFGAHHKNLNEDRPILWQRACSPKTSVSGSIKFMRIYAGFPGEGVLWDQWKPTSVSISLYNKSLALSVKFPKICQQKH